MTRNYILNWPTSCSVLFCAWCCMRHIKNYGCLTVSLITNAIPMNEFSCTVDILLHAPLALTSKSSAVGKLSICGFLKDSQNKQ
jgi:hypothetical protein